jgi:hypothetical protein
MSKETKPDLGRFTESISIACGILADAGFSDLVIAASDRMHRSLCDVLNSHDTNGFERRGINIQVFYHKENATNAVHIEAARRPIGDRRMNAVVFIDGVFLINGWFDD